MESKRRPLPEPDEVTSPFWEGCAARTLRFQCCRLCGRNWLPPSVVCPRCWCDEIDWVEASGKGEIFSFAVYRRTYHPAFPPPYVVAVVELAEGPRLISNIVDASPEELCIGMPVALEFLAAGDALLPVFRPAKKGDRSGHSV